MDDSDTQANLGQFSDTDTDAVQINEAPDHNDDSDPAEAVTFPAEDGDEDAEDDTTAEEPLITDAAAEDLNEMLDTVEECMDGDIAAEDTEDTNFRAVVEDALNEDDPAAEDDSMGEEFVAGFESQPAPNAADTYDRADLVAFDALVDRVNQTVSKSPNA